MTHERNASASSSISRPQKCIIFLENMGEPSSIWLRINKEKGKILASNTTSGTCALYNFQPCVYKKKTWTLSFSIYSTYILILNIGLCDSVLTSWWNSLEKVLCPSCTVSLLTCLSIYLSVLSVCFICSSVCLSFCFTACLSSWLSVCSMSVCLLCLSDKYCRLILSQSLRLKVVLRP